MAFAPRGLLIGLIQVGGLTDGERADAHVRLASRAEEESYALVATFELVGDPSQDEGTYIALDGLAGQLNAQAVMVVGEADLKKVQKMAEQARILIRSLE